MLESAYQFVAKIFEMKKYSPLVLGLLTSTLLVTAPVQAVPVAQTPELPASKKPATSVSTLTLQDLPSGFQELPAQIKPLIAAQLDTIKRVLGQQNLQLDNSFSFVNQQPLEVVLGFSSTLPNQPLALLRFDASLQQLQPNLGKKFQEELQAVQPGINVVDYKVLPDLDNIANSSRGITLAIKMQGIPPLRMEMVGFRRNKVGSFTAVFYLDGTQPVISVKDVATKLDDRILQSSPAANSSRVGIQ